jgi:hypothetical protein
LPISVLLKADKGDLYVEPNIQRHARRFQGEETCVNLLCSLPPRRSCRPESCCPLRPMPVATGGARLDIIGIGTAPVLCGSTHTGASAGMAIAGIARARKTSALITSVGLDH